MERKAKGENVFGYVYIIRLPRKLFKPSASSV